MTGISSTSSAMSWPDSAHSSSQAGRIGDHGRPGIEGEAVALPEVGAPAGLVARLDQRGRDARRLQPDGERQPAEAGADDAGALHARLEPCSQRRRAAGRVGQRARCAPRQRHRRLAAQDAQRGRRGSSGRRRTARSAARAGDRTVRTRASARSGARGAEQHRAKPAVEPRRAPVSPGARLEHRRQRSPGRSASAAIASAVSTANGRV